MEVFRLDLQKKIQIALNQNFGVALSQLVIVKRNRIPRTSSGKLQRQTCKQMFLRNEFKLL